RHTSSYSLLGGVHVSLEIKAYRGGGATLTGFSAPYPLVVLLQFGDVGKAGRLDPRFGLSLGETVAAGHGGIRIVLTGSVDGLVIRTRLGRRVLSQCSRPRNQSNTNK